MIESPSWQIIVTVLLLMASGIVSVLSVAASVVAYRAVSRLEATKSQRKTIGALSDEVTSLRDLVDSLSKRWNARQRSTRSGEPTPATSSTSGADGRLSPELESLFDRP
jgi:cell division protein FtsB